MSRLIDADALKEYFFRPYSNEELYSNIDLERIIDEQPTIEERKTGEWITNLYAYGEDRYECDQCHNTALHCYDFCPNCGVDMRGEEE